MRLLTLLAVMIFLALGPTSWAGDTRNRDDVSLADLEQLKLDHVNGRPDPQGLIDGEDIPNAIPIPGLPYNASGYTCDFVDDYDEACPYTGSTSPDVVYSYTPGGTWNLDIDLCYSEYDTKVYVYEDSEATLVACNDDACGPAGFRSELISVPMSPSSTYYIVVDGYGGDCGAYDLWVTDGGGHPCLACPPQGVLEGEPDCFDDYVDATNGGCNSSPPVFSSVPCVSPVTMCGTYGGFVHSGFNYRDTDWYELPQGSNVGNTVMCVLGEHETLIGYVDADLGCDTPTFEDYVILFPCTPECLEVSAGNKWLFVATANYGPVAGPCGSDYNLTIEGLACEPISIEPVTWGDLKRRYR